MGDEKVQYEHLPIPTYEEATSSRPGSSHLGPEHSSDDLERQGLLQHGSSSDNRPTRNGGYQPPTVESARSSIDYLASSAENTPRESMEELRRELHEMDVDDSGQSSSQSTRPPLRHRFSKQFSSLTKTLSYIQFPFRNMFPRLRFRYDFWRIPVNEDGQGCIIILRVVGLLLVVLIIYIFFVSDLFTMGSRLSVGQSYTPSSVENFVQSHINQTNIAENLDKVTQYAHIAGTEGSFVLAEWIEQEFARAGLEEIEMEEFQVYLNYPRPDGRRVAIVDPPNLAWQAALDEDQAYKDPPRQQTLVFHGHSKSGNVTGPLVYANYGSREDFQRLADNGVSLNGSIALVRYYGTQGDRALKVKAAELAGAAGCIIYSDPAEDGFVQGPAYPDGRYMPKDGVQRGAVSLMSWVVGDVLSPGFASTPDEKKRLSPGESLGLVQIPSIPIAWRDAQRLLQVLKGHGSKVPADWVGGVPDILEWWTGDHSSPKVNLMNLQDEVERQPIYNVIGRITGMEQPEKKIVVGNHRDSWCFGGVDPGSGTATFLEVVRVFGELRSLGWRPLRTIEFASWDGEEYNLIGSTEHVENEIDSLRKDGFAYLNVDVGVSGDSFEASGSPLFQRILYQVMNRIGDGAANKTLKEIWDDQGQNFAALGAGSDYVAFQDMAGTSSIDFGFSGAPFPYHSCYENFEWMTRFGDPGFEHHRMLAEFWALLLLELVDSPILPFDLIAYATDVAKYVGDLEKYAKSKGVPLKPAPQTRQRAETVDLKPLYDAAGVFQTNAAEFQAWEQAWYTTVYGSGGFESNVLGVQRINHNNRIADFETNLLDLSEGGGVPNRTQFKHVLFAPQTWSGYDEGNFPAIRDAIDTGNWNATQSWINRVAEIITVASLNLNR
ncbi:putative glutamate carboxypeptidase Tre2 [Talaromyces proteolyticus]|uniref:Glutamate carboxypeptidase Tre2 n=1 Tax=Talaromyces proteolyticus TaxID=1131652 RepID=A0AAD4KM27_9EURO|nr:putative glutamate carboxypeptidase Tre2 [Talaromyces proteolyticus]KAH8694921.1 putative glutamate carboxypeptidase Tre2 [Talaromyces proteolyticus]